VRVPDPDQAAIDEQRLRPAQPAAGLADPAVAHPAAADPGSADDLDRAGWRARNVAVSALLIANALLFLTITVITVVAMIRLALSDLGPLSLIFAVPAAATGAVTALTARAWRRNRRQLPGARGNALFSIAAGIILLLLYLALRNGSGPGGLGYSDREMQAMIRFFGFLLSINVPIVLLGIRPPKSTKAAASSGAGKPTKSSGEST